MGFWGFLNDPSIHPEDSATKSLEDKVNEIGPGLRVAAQVFKEKEEKRRIQRARWKEEMHQREEERERARQEAARLAHLEKMVEAHAKATRIRALVDAVRRQR
ncbi:MAG: hypothetical protein HN348_10990, partial [Proteobacteria bacterium]|nr:hypothetical protein [Pseudomonadota bacterium]